MPVDGKLVANPNKTWNEIDPPLPAEKIEVLGPPPTSGTRDAFVELVDGRRLRGVPRGQGPDRANAKQGRRARAIREDGAYVDAGENDNLIVQKLEANPAALGDLRLQLPRPEHRQAAGQHDRRRRRRPSRTSPTASTRSRARCSSTSRTRTSASIPGIREFVAEFTSEAAIGEDGYLADKGLIPLPEDEREKVRAAAAKLTPVSM